MFKDLLNAARNNFAAHQREEEIRHLDIDPEEYVMLRDDKTPMAAELLRAILEKLKIPNWEVDDGTLRIVRISETPSVRKNWSLAMTSDTRRFHLKVYRDFEGELDEIDLASSRGLCAAIGFVEQTIHDIRERKIQEAEMQRLAAIEEERRRRQEEFENVIATVDQINEIHRNRYLKELSAAKLGEEMLSSAGEYIGYKVDAMQQAQITLPAGDDIVSMQRKFDGKQFRIIDNVPCEFDETNSMINVSNRFIKSCIEGKNFISPSLSVVKYEPETRSLIQSTAEKSGVHFDDYANHHAYLDKRLDGLTNPLLEAERLLASAAELEANVKGDVAKISVLSVYSEVSSFKDLRPSIDSVLAGISENVNLIIWNARNSN